MSNNHYDAIVIGAGHNGLTTANYLAMQGLKVCVLEQRHIVGGAAVSEEFHPGYRNSIASYVVSLLRPEVIDDLQLKKYGYQTLPLDNAFYPNLNGDYLLLGKDEEENRKQFNKFSKTDYDSYQELHDIIDKVGDVVAKQWLKPPPKLSGGGATDLLNCVKLGLDFYKLDNDSKHRMLQLFIGAPETLIERWFESDKIKAVMAQHCLPSTFTSLHQPGSAMSMLHHAVGGIDGVKGAWGLVKGGMGGITQAMAKSAIAKGVVIKTCASVAKINIENNHTTGVTLDDGQIISTKIVAANTDPKRTFLTLVGAEHLPSSFAKDINVIRQESASLRMNLALNGLPKFACIPGDDIGEHHKSTISIIENKDHVERAYRSARAGIPADPPIIEALIPSIIDDSLAPEGHHVMSLLCKYMPYDLEDGKHWDQEKENVVKNILAYLGKYISNLDEILVSYQCLSPLDLERMFGMTRGDICHGRLEPDQLFSMRPHPEAAQYSTPIKGLYLCGSGSHPGGGVTGAPGFNAAKKILQDR
ncbi:NAD(P)/FAD-dependent oxidoreductase [Thalassotalea nanhaiensis]|uniref:NAD(P)/FAD-dependent oxidoreductase n=1 Tax=Thalassotalea nanhaiensis TaxID=3065648 RepID=A0ABY9TJC7_9GAMM|nr:NAD(P)/FAD-dependent oxidoreductase [Colwelliaceae bacterium SQ345]